MKNQCVFPDAQHAFLRGDETRRYRWYWITIRGRNRRIDLYGTWYSFELLPHPSLRWELGGRLVTVSSKHADEARVKS
jgi:hypothetical protein